MRTSTTPLILVLLAASAAVGAIGTARATPAYQQCAQVEITSPEPGAELRGIVTIEGSASIGDFQFYKAEYSTAAQLDLWRAVSQTYEQPKISGTLDTWDTLALPDGEYNLKLTAVDRRGQEVCRDIVRDLTIANTEPTPTPTAEAPGQAKI